MVEKELITVKKKNKVFVIAEAGVNHNGKIEFALEMIKSAKRAGADCVKFQAFSLDKLTSSYAQSADYQKNNTGVSKQKKNARKAYFNYS